ncbi:uncharacterized protein LOC119295139 [Triticum dicoccoides]|uniref:Uncharacterized protein n=2 Tax=Triticum TaxID=4564 RepID=A0A9R0SW76_TRITD|nr:uncharacterized protein LOC119295139 [Triticum dicoccoides]XP_037429370.1 uncharacterized protein LOC119295139 [Triticum dicoccoides]XP_044368500.1 uncharacterized protein LOC123091155 [Triticum aestivum]XP_044368501.1 uncharacterized protein LOC123091155 [Triticum aestivum]VAI02624.1 unnamed protein product [Triticum turgidum subsp. durum]
MARARIPEPKMDLCLPPTFAYLDRRAGMTTKKMPGPVVAAEWTCTNRGGHKNNDSVLNNPTNNFLLMLPPLFCKECHRVNPAGYCWDIPHISIRDVLLDFLVRNQGDYNTSVAHAFLTAVDAMRTIHEAFTFRAEPGTELDDGHLFTTYMRIFKTAFGYETGPCAHLRFKRPECIAYILQNHGVGFDCSSMQDGYRQRATPDFTQKIGKVFRIANRGGVGRIEQIIRLIAGGFPLFCHYAAGRAFDFVDGNEVYHAPAKAGINHAAVLIGSGVHEYPGEGSKIYLRARGSRDDAANPQSALQGKGGDFNIWAEDVTDVLGFHLA